MNCKEFFKRFGIGAAIGAGMIIPGVSGGTIAVLFNIYDKLISAISDLRKDFKNSFFFLLPILLGAAAAICAAYFPLKFALDNAPLATVMLFAGLMTGSLPKVINDGRAFGFKKINILSVAIPFVAVIGICFLPNLGNVNLGGDMPVWGYFVLILMGALASCALVIPGVSGSMLLLIFGYYQPILNTVSALKDSFGHSLLVLVLFALGILIGFISIAKLMKFLLKKFPRGTHWAIIGFVVGSIPAIFLSFDYNTEIGVAQLLVGTMLCLIGIILAYTVTQLAADK